MRQGHPTNPTLLRFGIFELDVAAGELRKRGLRIKLQPQPLRILAMLLESPGEIVTRELLYEKLWSSTDTFVEFEHSLNASVAKLRQALGDSAENPRFIETLARRGYRFIGPIEAARAEPETPQNGAVPSAVQIALPDPAPVAASPIRIRSRTALITVAAALSLLVTAAVWLLRFRNPEPAPLVVSITTDQGTLVDPALSPDGRQVAYVWDGPKHDNFDIYVKLIASPSTLRLTRDPEQEHHPAWSPDGREIAFSRGEAIYATSPLGGPERKLADVPGINSAFSWSAEGKWLAVAQSQTPQAAGGIFLISVDGLQRRRLTTRDDSSYDLSSYDLWPAFSPDGRRLAYITCKIAVCVLSYQDLAPDLSPKEEPHRLKTGVIPRSFIAWTADSQAVIYDRRLVYWQLSNDHLWKIAIQPGSEPQALGYTDQGARCPTVSRSGNRLVYERANFDFDIWKWKGGRTEELIASTALDDVPAYSPDGRKIAFGSSRSGTYQIWEANADGSNPVQLTFSSLWSGMPSWSPDGHWVVYDGVGAEGQNHIFVIDAAGGPPRQITDFNSYRPNISRDGRWIYFGSPKGIYRVPFGGGKAALVIDHGGDPRESWDGKGIYYQMSRSSPSSGGGLYYRPLNGGPEKQIVDFVFSIDFAVTREGIYYIGKPSNIAIINPQMRVPDTIRAVGAPNTEEKGSFPLLLLDPNTSKSRLLGTIEQQIAAGLSVSPDGSVAYSVYLPPPSPDLRLVEHFH